MIAICITRRNLHKKLQQILVQFDLYEIFVRYKFLDCVSPALTNNEIITVTHLHDYHNLRVTSSLPRAIFAGEKILRRGNDVFFCMPPRVCIPENVLTHSKWCRGPSQRIQTSYRFSSAFMKDHKYTGWLKIKYPTRHHQRSVRIKQLQEFLKSDHWLRRYCILSGGVFYFEPPCTLARQNN